MMSENSKESIKVYRIGNTFNHITKSGTNVKGRLVKIVGCGDKNITFQVDDRIHYPSFFDYKFGVGGSKHDPFMSVKPRK